MGHVAVEERIVTLTTKVEGLVTDVGLPVFTFFGFLALVKRIYLC